MEAFEPDRNAIRKSVNRTCVRFGAIGITMYYYSLPSTLSDDLWKREFIHEMDQMVIDMTKEKKLVEEALTSRNADNVYASFNQNAMRAQRRDGQELLNSRERDPEDNALSAEKYVPESYFVCFA
jgi:hypothetical protein